MQGRLKFWGWGLETEVLRAEEVSALEAAYSRRFGIAAYEVTPAPRAEEIGLRAPRVFGKVLSQSGAFSIMGHDFVVFDLIRDSSARPIRTWMDAGKFEWLLECNRRMRDLMTSKGYPVEYREHSGGHNYPAWRDDVWRGLEHLFATTN